MLYRGQKARLLPSNPSYDISFRSQFGVFRAACIWGVLPAKSLLMMSRLLNICENIRESIEGSGTFWTGQNRGGKDLEKKRFRTRRNVMDRRSRGG